MKKTLVLVAMVLAVAVLTAGCAGHSYQVRQSMVENAVNGGLLGAIVGGAVGALSGDFGTGALIGVAAGGVLGLENTPRDDRRPVCICYANHHHGRGCFVNDEYWRAYEAEWRRLERQKEYWERQRARESGRADARRDWYGR